MKRLVLSGALVFMAGCANPKQVMVNPGNWQQVTCAASGWGWIGAPQAYSITDKCISNQRVLGYIPLEEAEIKEAPKFSGNASAKDAGVLPTWSDGDTWEYSVNGSTTKFTVKKPPVSQQYRVDLATGTNIFNASLGLEGVEKDGMIDTIYSPALRPFDWPLHIGKAWDSSGEMKRNGGSIALSTHHEVKGFGRVKVPAGEFDAYYILAKNDYGARVSELWYAPAVKYYVKGVVYTNSGMSTEELVNFSLK